MRKSGAEFESELFLMPDISRPGFQRGSDQTRSAQESISGSMKIINFLRNTFSLNSYYFLWMEKVIRKLLKQRC